MVLSNGYFIFEIIDYDKLTVLRKIILKSKKYLKYYSTYFYLIYSFKKYSFKIFFYIAKIYKTYRYPEKKIWL